jgi:hypothetical protein
LQEQLKKLKEPHPKSKRILELEEEIKEREWELKVNQDSCDINHTRKRARHTRRARHCAIGESISSLDKKIQT